MAKRKKIQRKDPKRLAAGKKGYRNRLRRERAEFLRRSKASKKGWRRRKARERIQKKAKQKPKGKGKLREWVVTFTYFGRLATRTLGFTVIARSEQDALTFVYKAIANGEDSNGYDLEWAQKIPWDEVEATRPVEAEMEGMDNAEIKQLGEGWVETH